MDSDQNLKRTYLSKQPGVVLAFAVIYCAVDLGLNKFTFDSGWTIMWPLNGVTIALLLMRKRREWPALLLGVVLGTGVGEFLDGGTVVFTIFQRIISLLEVVLSASLLPSFASLAQWLREPRIFKRFIGALTLGPGVSGILAAILFHYMRGEPYLLAFNSWATSDALGIAATMPLAISLQSPEMRNLFRGTALRRTVPLLVGALSVSGFLFAESRYPLLFLLYPVLLLTDFALTFCGSAIAVFAVCLMAVYLTTHGYGQFGTWSVDHFVSRDVALQIFLGFHVLALFPASVLSVERRRMAEELRDTNAQLIMLASLDGLTGLANRRSLDERFAQEWNRAIRLKTPLALVMIDIDHFKQFNDLYGHPAGDQCLQDVAGVLTKLVGRVQDHVARFGGEEFALVLPHTSLQGAMFVAEKLLEGVFQLNLPHEGSNWKRITVSIGCAVIVPLLGEDRVGLLQRADQALYAAKESGRNRVAFDSVPKPGQVDLGSGATEMGLIAARKS